MVAYMNALGAAATAGTTLQTPNASPGNAGTSAVQNAATSPGTSGSQQTPCPPKTMPVIAVGQTASSTGPGAAAPAAAQTLTASALSTDLQNLSKAIPGVKISTNDANAASTLVALIQDAATTYLREQAVRGALKQGHDSFPAAVNIEEAAISYVQEQSQSYVSDLNGELGQASVRMASPQQRIQSEGQTTATRFLLAFARGDIPAPQQAQDIAAAAQTYLSALDSLLKAYSKLSDASAGGNDVLTAATWKDIQPLLTDVGNAYAALNKL